MAIYELCSKKNKSNMQLMTDENVPDAVQYIEYRGDFYERDESVIVNNAPNPYIWKDAVLPLAEGAVSVNGKDLISKTTFTKQAHEWSGNTLTATERAAETAQLAAKDAQIAALQAQLATAVSAELAEPAVDPRVAELEAKLAAAEEALAAATAPVAGDDVPQA